MEKSFKITLSDGTKFENLKLNGNYYITQKEITEKDFQGKLLKVVIEDLHYEDGYYFALREMTQDELDKIKTQADIEYLAMMSNVELEEV